MAGRRRSKSSMAEDLMVIVSRMPWWVGVLAALVSYVALHRVAVHLAATLAAAPPARPGQAGSMVLRAMGMAAANLGQYVLPIVCLAGAALSAWQRSARGKLVTDVAQAQSADALNGMSWRQFEQLVGEGFRRQGYEVLETGGGGPDGGVDLVLARPTANGREKVLVQCKQWRALKVGVSVVRELYGVMAARGAAGGVVVTSGRYTDEAIAFAQGRNIELMDGPKLHALIRQGASASKSGVAATRAAPVQTAPPPDAPPARADHSADAPAYPVCSKPMVRRTAKRGAKADNAFWGCTGYPACRGTREVG